MCVYGWCDRGMKNDVESQIEVGGAGMMPLVYREHIIAAPSVGGADGPCILLHAGGAHTDE